MDSFREGANVNHKNADVVVIGGGAAGVAAGAAAAKEGARTVLIERENAPGGVLDQCIHPGFGLHRYKEELTGPEFAHRLIAEIHETDAEILSSHYVLGIDPIKRVVSTVGPDGIVETHAKSVILATGARERPFSALMIPGPRPAGIFAAGLAQKFVNIHGVLPGRRAIVLGSGDIGLIMARRLHLEGVEVVAVVEMKAFPGGLMRNVVQCLEDFGIPLFLRRTVVAIHGEDRLEGVTLADVDEEGQPIRGTEERIDVDTLVVSVGLIPETELISSFVELEPINGGPPVNSRMQTPAPWLFAAGNNVAVFDLVDWVAVAGERAGRFAAQYARGDLTARVPIRLIRGENVLHMVPSSLDRETITTLFLRVPRPLLNVEVVIGGVSCHRQLGARPSEMIEIPISAKLLSGLSQASEARVEVREG